MGNNFDKDKGRDLYNQLCCVTLIDHVRWANLMRFSYLLYVNICVCFQVVKGCGQINMREHKPLQKIFWFDVYAPKDLLIGAQRFLLDFSDKLWWAHKLCWEIWSWHTVEVPGLWQEWYLYSGWFCCWFTRLSADQCEENVLRGVFTLTLTSHILWLGCLFVCDRQAYDILIYKMYYIVNCSTLQEQKV